MPLRIGTRGSRLALWQAEHVADRLRSLGQAIEVVEIQTVGDQVRDRPLGQIGGEGVFTKEIQRAVLAGSVDLAVHSLKDLPTLPIEGLVLAAVPERGHTHDVFVSRRHARFAALPAGAVVATGSQRRKAQLWQRRPDLQIVDIRGNVDTRLRKLEEEKLDGLVLARAGLERLGLSGEITEMLEWMLPAVGQGALGLECRADDRGTLEVVRQLDDVGTRQAVLAERALLRTLQGGCQVPLGALGRVVEAALSLEAVVLSPDGKRSLRGRLEGPPNQAEDIGNRLAEQLLKQGAADLLGL